MATDAPRRGLRTPGLDHVGLHVPSMREAVGYFQELGYVTVWSHGPYRYAAGRWSQSDLTPARDQRHHLGHAEGAQLRLSLLRLSNGPNLELIEISYPSEGGRWCTQYERDHGRHAFIAWSVRDLDYAISDLEERGLARNARRCGDAFAFESPWGQRLAIQKEPEAHAGTAGPWLPSRATSWRSDSERTGSADVGAPPASIATVTGTVLIGFNVADLDAAERFFCTALGFEPIARNRESALANALFPPEAKVEELLIRCGNSNLMLAQASVDGAPLYDAEAARRVAHPAWYVSNLEQAVGELGELGLHVDSLMADMFGEEAGEEARYLHFLHADQDLELVSFPHGRSGEARTTVIPWHPGKPQTWINPEKTVENDVRAPSI